MRAPSILALATSLLLLVACSGLRSGAPLEQLYVMRPAAASSQAQPLAAAIELERTQVQPGLDTDRIALLLPGNRLNYYAGVRWAAPLADMFQALLTQSMRQSGRFAQVTSDGSGTTPDLSLLVTVRHLEADYPAENAAPIARVLLECTLTSRHLHRQIAQYYLQAQVPASANRQASVVAALERATQEALADTIDRTAHEAAAATAGPRPPP